MRVGANARQYAQIKKMHANGVPAQAIAMKLAIESQSLEHILAHIDDREEVVLAIRENPALQAMQDENKELLERLAKYEDVDGAPKSEPEPEPAPAPEPGNEDEVD